MNCILLIAVLAVQSDSIRKFGEMSAISIAVVAKWHLLHDEIVEFDDFAFIVLLL
jgi:hypothetical protein